MQQPDAPAQPCLYTVGHSNHELPAFLALLQQHAIQVLVDTRSQPYSRRLPHFSREELQPAVERARLKYLFLGKELGGRPDEPTLYDEEGHVLYARVAETALFRAGIERLEKGSRAYRVALLCSEEDPTVCHRHLLVGRVMAERGTIMRHIRGDGSLQSDAELPGGALVQPFLFDFMEDDAWKSPRSVLRRKVPAPSSDSSASTASDDSSMCD